MKSDRDMDALLVDWLYGELDGEEKRRFEAYLEGSAEARAQVAAMQRTREAFGGLRDAGEEPPAAVSAILLHEAAQRAGQRGDGERQGGFVAWLSSLARPFVLHPAAAALASLALVAGVAGTLYVRKADAPPPPARSAAPAPQSEGELAPPAAELTAAQAPEPGAPQPERVGALADAELEARLDESRAEADDAARAKRARAQVAKRRGKATRERGPDGARLVARDKPRPAEKKAAAAKLEGAESSNAISGGAVGGSAPALEVAATRGRFAEPPPPQGAPRAAVSADADADDWAAAQTAALRRAARAKKCGEAARIANDLREREPELYRREVEGSKTLAPCRSQVVAERRRRQAEREAADAEAKPAETDAEPAESR